MLQKVLITSHTYPLSIPSAGVILAIFRWHFASNGMSIQLLKYGLVVFCQSPL